MRSDNGSAYVSAVHALACKTLGIKHLRTRPYPPRTNGKAERLIRTLLGGWAYGAIDGNSEERRLALTGWLDFSNRRRPHGSLNHQPPLKRLEALTRNNLAGSYSLARLVNLGVRHPRAGAQQTRGQFKQPGEGRGGPAAGLKPAGATPRSPGRCWMCLVPPWPAAATPALVGLPRQPDPVGPDVHYGRWCAAARKTRRSAIGGPAFGCLHGTPGQMRLRTLVAGLPSPGSCRAGCRSDLGWQCRGSQRLGAGG